MRICPHSAFFHMIKIVASTKGNSGLNAILMLALFMTFLRMANYEKLDVYIIRLLQKTASYTIAV